MQLYLYSLDQISKYAAVKYLKGQKPVVIIENLLQFTYVENRGLPWYPTGQENPLPNYHHSSSFNYYLYLIRYYHQMNKVTKISFALLIAGAIGNLIDRVRLGYVVDFISVRLINRYDFPVFNIADICVVISTIFIVYLVLFDKIEIGDMNGFN